MPARMAALFAIVPVGSYQLPFGAGPPKHSLYVERCFLCRAVAKRTAMINFPFDKIVSEAEIASYC